MLVTVTPERLDVHLPILTAVTDFGGRSRRDRVLDHARGEGAGCAGGRVRYHQNRHILPVLLRDTDIGARILSLSPLGANHISLLRIAAEPQ